MTRQACRSRHPVAPTCLIGAALFSAVMPCLAEAFGPGPGWANAPEVRRHNRAKEAGPLVPGWAPAPKPDPRIVNFEPDGPRAFGLLTGDKVRLRLEVAVKKPYRLQESSLPPSQWMNTWLELQDVEVKETEHDEVNRYVIVVHYQIFSTPRVVTLDVIPGFDLRFASKNESFPLTVPNWAFSISPLLKPEPEVEVIAEIPVRGDAPPPLIDATVPAYGVALFASLSAALGACWLYLNSIWPFRRRGKTPFAWACRRLRAIKRRTDHDQALRDGFRIVHQAFNQTAGEVVFAEHLERFFRARPAFASQRTGIETFFEGSRQLFFGARPKAPNLDLASLESLCRQWRAVERAAR